MLKSRAVILALTLLSPATALPCDFCMLGQGVSPYLMSSGYGLTFDTRYTESTTVYDHAAISSDGQKKEAWLIESLTGFYSLTDRLNVSAVLPFAAKTNLDYDAANGNSPGVLVTGMGDLTLSGRYTLLSDHTLTSTLIVGVIGGIKLPTGPTDVKDLSGATVDRHALPGTGSFDYLIGTSAAYSFGGAWQLTADAVYDVAGPGKWGSNDHRYGNSFNYSLKGFYKLLPATPGEKALYLFTGASGETLGQETGTLTDTGYQTTLVNASSGGTVIYWDIGIHATLSTSVVLNTGISKAVFHDMNFDPTFDADPAENYKFDFSLTYLF